MRFMMSWGDVPTWIAVVVGAVGGGAALWQLGLQRTQLRAQQKVIADQASVLGRQQADRIDVAYRTIGGAAARVLPPESEELVHLVAVTNGSSRPIRNVSCKIEACPVGASVAHDRLAACVGEFVDMRLGSDAVVDQFVRGENTDHMSVLRSGQKGTFVFPFTTDHYPRPRFTVRFTDDAGLDWQIDHDLHLTKLDGRDW